MNAVAEARLASAAKESVESPALVVDLDGTLVKTDLLLEAVLVLLKQKLYYAFRLLLWLMKGKAYFKRQVARQVSLDVAVLPYREEVLDYLREQRAHGRKLVLATGCDIQIARLVADHLDLFDLVLASDGETNLTGASKRDRLVNEFGEKHFDYAGNGRHDVAVWASARKAVLVNPSPRVRSKAAQVAQVECVLEGPRKGLADYLKPLRLQHWWKNILVFVPLLAAHRFDEIGLLAKLLLAFCSFGCFASSGYLMNDLFDLPADRHHPTKRFRPFASGDLPLWYAFATIPALAGIGCLIGTMVSRPFLEVVLSYFALTLTYSLYLKRVVLLDVIVLAGLYTMRIMAGAAAIAIWPSHWLLAFSTFFFFSLALVKRYSELVIMRKIDGDRAKARGYELDDGELLAAMGVASGFLAVLVLALYINSDKAQALYGRYQLIWFLCPLLLYWISRVWLIAHRGKMPDDPMVFAMNDRTSRILILLMSALVVLAL
jgi:4-hydroxybenzoate polyprenyltransferase/phosphoserine phosphatase